MNHVNGAGATAYAELAASLSRHADSLARADAVMFGGPPGAPLDVTCPEAPAISFTGSQAPYVAPNWGPARGWSWFVQLVTVGPLGSGDTLALYRGKSTADNQLQRLKNEFAGTAGAWQVWHPGRTGLQLVGGRDGLVFDGGSGTLTSGTRYFVNVDVIQVADAALTAFLV